METNKVEPNKTTREPRQSRSIQTKERILDAAYRLFCEKGFYKTTTNEIARVADVSIGSLYAYFQDKDTILLEILDRFNRSFMKIHETLSREVDHYRSDPKAWLRQFITGMVEVHRASKELNRELQILRYSMPGVAAVLDKQQETIRQTTYGYICLSREMLRVQDLEAAAVITNLLISSVVDQIVFCQNPIGDERILDAGADAVYQYMIGDNPPPKNGTAAG